MSKGAYHYDNWESSR